MNHLDQRNTVLKQRIEKLRKPFIFINTSATFYLNPNRWSSSFVVADGLYTQLLSPTGEIRTRWNNYKELRDKIKYYLMIVIIVICNIIINSPTKILVFIKSFNFSITKYSNEIIVIFIIYLNIYILFICINNIDVLVLIFYLYK